MAEKSQEEVEFDKAKKYGGDTRSWMRIYLKRLKEAAVDGDLKACRTIIQDFRKQEQKLPGVYARMRRALDAYRKMLEAGVSPGTAALVFPGDLSGLTDKGSAELDGAKMTRVVDSAGVSWLKREAGDAESGGKAQLESEAAVDAVYATLGIGAPMSKMYGDVKLTQDVGGDSLAEFLDGSASKAEKEAARDQFMEGLDIDCMLANWSCVGGNSDTKFCVIKDGRVYRTGSYAAMSFRVKGGQKNSDGWGADPTDFFKLWTFGNQTAVLGRRKVNVLELMKKTVGRNWDGVKRIVPPSDWKVIEARIENVRKLIEYGEELQKDDPSISVDDLNGQLESFMKNKYKKPRKLTIVKPDEKLTRKPVESTDQVAKYKTGAEIKKRFKVTDFRNDVELLEKAIAEDGAGGAPQVVESFEELEKVCDYIGYRTVGADSVEQAEEFMDGMLNGEFYVKCGGGRAHGYGMYVAMANTRDKDGIRAAKRDSNGYGGGRVSLEFHIGTKSDFKWVDEYELGRMKEAETDKDIRRMDIGTYCKFKGFDGLYCMFGSYSYSVIVNRTKILVNKKIKVLENNL